MTDKSPLTDLRIPAALLSRTDLPPRALLIYGLLRENPSLTNAQLSEIFGVERQTTAVLVRSLKKAGLLVKETQVQRVPVLPANNSNNEDNG